MVASDWVLRSVKPFHRHLFRNRRTLSGYLRGVLPDCGEIIREIELLEREDDPRRPEHALLGARRLAFPDSVTSLPLLLDHVLGTLSEELLETHGEPPLQVAAGRFEDWQGLITDCPPMVLVARAILRDYQYLMPSVLDRDKGAIKTLLAVVQRQVQNSALPTVCDARLEYLIERDGLDDLHMHLNGSSEVELVWLDALAQPRKFAAEFVKTSRKDNVCRQLMQEERALDHAGLLRRLRLASALRYQLARAAFGSEWDFESFSGWLQTSSGWGVPWPFRANQHPLVTCFGLELRGATSLARETVLWVCLLAKLGRVDDLWYAHAFYAYLLIFCQFQRLSVQQRDQVGFDQFQRIAENGLREHFERRYESRYQQLVRSERGDIAVLEGRFAPKGDRKKLGDLLCAIIADWSSADTSGSRCSTLGAACAASIRRTGRERLRLVAHFIKKADTARHGRFTLQCRHHVLRTELDRQWHILRRLIERYPALNDFVVGFDAAGNELHAPPEVFAPTFRRIRRLGGENFTFHAGEDFVHLVAGLRAMSEAVMMLGLRAGNRIGHGTAMGIDVALWQRSMPEKIVVRRQDRLDDLVWARRVLSAAGLVEGIVMLDDEIGALAREIYGNFLDGSLLYRAWSLRHLDPRTARRLDDGTEEVYLSCDHVQSYADARKARDEDPKAFELFLRYHQGDVIERGGAWLEVDAVAKHGPLDARGLHRLQCLVADEIRRRGIVMEVLPTSNVRISFYPRYGDHHVFRWLGVTGEKPIPVVLGTDDPGIFATSLRNEYLHVLRELDARCEGGAEEAVRHLEALVKNGKRYNFRPRRSVNR